MVNRKLKANKKGIIRIIEAVVASMIILTAVLLISTKAPVTTGKDLTGMIEPILDEIASNNTLREMILSGSADAKQDILALIDYRVKTPAIGYDATICRPEEPCPLTIEPYPSSAGGIYSADRIISSVLTEREFNPRKVKIFFWIKK